MKKIFGLLSLILVITASSCGNQEGVKPRPTDTTHPSLNGLSPGDSSGYDSFNTRGTATDSARKRP